jgi:hypothetical protein
MFKPRFRIGGGRLRVAMAGSALLLAMPCAMAGPVAAQTDACLEESAAVRACSTKELSNVVVQCGDESGSFFVKYDELDDGTYEGLIDPYTGVFTCPSGDVIAVFVKSGNNRYDGTPIDGLPRGSGALWTPLACSEDPAECETPDDGDEGGDEGGDAGDRDGECAASHSTFWTCSRICSIRTLSSTAERVVSTSCDFDDSVFASRLNSCIRKSSLRPTASPEARVVFISST